MLREISVKRSASLNSRISEYHGHRILFDADQRVLSFMCLQNNRVNEQNDFFTMAFLFCTNPWLQTRISRKVCHKQIDRFHENALDVTSWNEINVISRKERIFMTKHSSGFILLIEEYFIT